VTDYIVFPDTVALLCDYLNAQTGIDTGRSVPHDRTDSSTFLRLQRTGGPRHTLVSDAATVIVESWAPTPEEAHDLAQEVRALVNALQGQIVDDVPVYLVNEVSGPADLPDPLSNQSRYTQTFEVHVRGTVSGS
jgi:hypothetical protein